MDIHIDIIYNYTRYDVIRYFWSEVIVKNCRKYRTRRLLVEFLQNGLSTDHKILPIFREQSASQIYWKLILVAASGCLQNAIKYCTKERKKKRVWSDKKSNNSTIV